MSEYATTPDPTSIRLERLLPGPVERVWAYLVEPEKRALWFVGGVWDLRVGGEAQVAWDHRKLSHEPTPHAWKDFDGTTTTGTITRVEAPRLLSYRTGPGGGDSEVTFELEPRGKDVLLTITQTPIADAQMKAGFASGWHAYLGILEDRLNGATPRGFWTYFDKLQGEYADRF
jgi:uncharacterized protein YndB with AHSA1/START domain